MAKRDVLLRLSKAQAEALQLAAAGTLQIMDAVPNQWLINQVQGQHLRIANMKLTKVLKRHQQKIAQPKTYKFDNVGCSSCGQSFGPGDHGFSHCEHHAGKKGYDR